MERIFEELLRAGVEALGLPVDAAAMARLVDYGERLLAWNRKVNLTAITAPREVAEKHFLDSLVLLPAVVGRRTLLDVGSGAGFPGMALACARTDLAVTCCDSVMKKVAFVKATAVALGVDVRGLAVRATGRPAVDGLPICEVVVSRALADPDRWVELGAPYVSPGGLLLAMLGKGMDRGHLEALGRAQGLTLLGVDQFELPFSKAPRSVVRWERPAAPADAAGEGSRFGGGGVPRGTPAEPPRGPRPTARDWRSPVRAAAAGRVPEAVVGAR